MKLQEAIILGRFVGLNTVEECILNIELHYWQMMPFSDYENESKEFYAQVRAYEAETLQLDWDYINKETQRQQDEYLIWAKTCEDLNDELDFLN